MFSPSDDRVQSGVLDVGWSGGRVHEEAGGSVESERRGRVGGGSRELGIQKLLRHFPPRGQHLSNSEFLK